mmetsp:Transcript_127519/g.285289  ORF Transcript_127519/g.285289 Transcript_127519/m.285289 type:complete len:360 (-) Transcript_127519:61-1140(-)
MFGHAHVRSAAASLNLENFPRNSLALTFPSLLRSSLRTSSSRCPSCNSKPAADNAPFNSMRSSWPLPLASRRAKASINAFFSAFSPSSMKSSGVIPIMHPMRMPKEPEARPMRRTKVSCAWPGVSPADGKPRRVVSASTVFPMEMPSTSAKVFATAAQATVDSFIVEPIMSSTTSPPTIMMLLSRQPKTTKGIAELSAKSINCRFVGGEASPSCSFGSTEAMYLLNSVLQMVPEASWSRDLKISWKSVPKCRDNAAMPRARASLLGNWSTTLFMRPSSTYFSSTAAASVSRISGGTSFSTCLSSPGSVADFVRASTHHFLSAAVPTPRHRNVGAAGHAASGCNCRESSQRARDALAGAK